MLPTLQIFHRTVALYGVMIAIGLIIGISIVVIRSKRYSIKYEDALFASFFAGIGLFLGAKLLFLLVSIPNFIKYYRIFAVKPAMLLLAFRDGYVFYGGLIGALIGIYIYCRIYRINLLNLLDLTAPSIPIIHGFGRIGCFFAGCCYGIPYQGIGHIIFHKSIAAPNGVALLPTQLMEAGINFIAGFLLLVIAQKPFVRSGQVIGFYFIYYSILRFVMEYFRGDFVRGFLFGLSTSQWISLLLLPLGVWLVIGRRKMPA